MSTRRLTGLTGLGSALVFAAGNALWAFEQPQPAAPADTLVAFYTELSGRIIVGASLSLVALGLFVFFASGLRCLLVETGRDERLAGAAFGGAILLVAAGIGAETVNLAGAVGAGVGIGVLLAALGLAALGGRPGTPPLALAGLATGVAFLTPLSQVLLLPAVVLFAVGSALLLRPWP